MKLALLTLTIGVGAISLAAPISYTFDTDNQGWTRGNFGNGFANIDPNHAGVAFWGAPGQINGIDHANFAFNFSGNLGGGHGDLFNGTVSFDFQYSGPDYSQVPLLVLMSSTDFLVLETAVVGGLGSYTNYSFALNDTTNWSFNSSDYYGTPVAATNAQIQAVLSDLQYIGVDTDLNNGGDNTMLDNVSLEPVPEPATMAILGLGAALVARRRRNK